MASKVAKAAQGGIKAWLLPEINDIKVQLAEMRGDVKSLTTRVDATNERIDSLRNELNADILRVETKIDSSKAELKSLVERVDGKVEDLDKRLDIAQRLAILEAKQREFEKKSH